MYKPPGGLYLKGRFNSGFLRYRLEGLIHRGAYFRNFMVLWSIFKKHEFCQDKTTSSSRHS